MTALTTAPFDARSLPSNASQVARLDHGPWAVCREEAGKGLGAGAMPAGQQSTGDVLTHERIGEVVAPVTVDVQEPSTHTLLPETELLDDPAAGGVLRPDVHLDPVQLQRPEAVV